MARSIPRSLCWLVWGLAAVWFSLVAAPRRVTGQDAPIGSRAYFSPRLAAEAPVPLDAAYFDGAPADPAPPEFSQPFTEAPSPAQPQMAIGAAEAPSYWIVSSRCDVQHRRHIPFDDGELDVFQRTPDGQLLQTNMGTLQSQIIPGIPVLMCVHGTFVSWEDE